MSDLRLVAYSTGLLITALGGLMLAPAFMDAIEGAGNWRAFVAASIFTGLVGGALILGSPQETHGAVSIQGAFLIVVVSWCVLPLFGALPFMLGAYAIEPLDAVFEAVSGMTTTGSTVLIGLEYMSTGVLLWRAMLQWIGGLGIVVFALVILPTLRIGGMQLFRSERMDGEGSLLIRFKDIAPTILMVYVGLTTLCATLYMMFGMPTTHAICNAMTTIATGGFATSDKSFAIYSSSIQLICVAFMLIASLPFLRYVEVVRLKIFRIHKDAQVRTFFAVVFCVFCILSYGLLFGEPPVDAATGQPISRVTGWDAVVAALFNGVSIITGSGFVSADYGKWGDAYIILFFFLMFIGGCAGSTTCSVKIFRYQVLALLALGELQRMRRPNRVVILRFAGNPITNDVAASVNSFFFLFFVSLLIFTILLSLTGENLITSISGAATALTNVGPGLGSKIGPVGTFSTVNDAGKAVLILAMLVGRLELLSIFVLLTPGFWRS